MEWNVLLGSADVSWEWVQAIRTAAKETIIVGSVGRCINN